MLAWLHGLQYFSTYMCHAKAIHTTPCIQGNAGSGKSWLIEKRLLPLLRIIYNVPEGPSGEDLIAITSSSGISSISIGGRTLHSWAGIKRGLGTVTNIVRNMSASCKKRLKKAVAAVVDEGSMVSHKVTDLINGVLQRIRGNSLPWGGLQVIWVADMLQLGPIGELHEVAGGDVQHGKRWLGRREPPWCFKARCWSALDFEPCLLTKNFRHADAAWARVLDLIARGDVHSLDKWQEVQAALTALMMNPNVNTGSTDCTRLHCTKNEILQVRGRSMITVWGGFGTDHTVPSSPRTLTYLLACFQVQKEALGRLEGTATRYNAFDEGHGLQLHAVANNVGHLGGPMGGGGDDGGDDAAGIESDVFNFFQPQCALDLKEGAKVICIKNISSGSDGGPTAPLLNGSIGHIIGFRKCTEVQDLPWLEESGMGPGE